MMSTEWRQAQLLRLSGLPRWPKSPEGRASLYAAAEKFETDAGCRRFVDDWLAEMQQAPVPADLYRAASVGRKEKREGPAKCTVCYDTGKAYAPFLVTWENGRKIAQRLTIEQEADLLRKNSEQEFLVIGKQMLYERTIPCECTRARQIAERFPVEAT